MTDHSVDGIGGDSAAPDPGSEEPPRQCVSVEVNLADDDWLASVELAGLVTAHHLQTIAGAMLSELPADVLEDLPEHCLATVVFSSDSDVASLNATYRGKDGPTNVLSFPSETFDPDVGAHYIGDVVLARETIEKEAHEAGKSAADHVDHLIVHGLLHLFGFDHLEPSQADEMEQLEVAILANLGISNPYLEEGIASARAG